VPGLGTTFGRGGATTSPKDLLNSDAILIMGSNMAENHPVAFQWVIDAREKGTQVIHVDPRFTRTSAMSNQWLPLRAGSDAIFLGALINYVLQNELVFKEYLVHYTNAPIIINDDFKDVDELGGVFSGWDEAKKRYDPSTWAYKGSTAKVGADAGGYSQQGSTQTSDLNKHEKDETLQHPRCVYQLLKKHFAKYTPELVEEQCGTSKEAFLRAAKTFCSASGPDKTGGICYAVGWTQHSSGVQVIRCAAILQLLLGNMGRPGGGIVALRGHASIQGCTDVPTLFDSLPGYLPMPKLDEVSKTLASFIKKYKTRTGWWNNFDKYIVSLLKAYYGDKATAENDYGFHWLPRLTADHSHQGYWQEMLDGKIEGLFVMGQNPAVAAPNAGLERRGLWKLKWLVVREMVEVETASFWYDSPEVHRGEVKPEDIQTEVFLMPAAGHAEKDGTFTNTQRLLQWREKAVEPPGDSRSENAFMFDLGLRLIEKARKDPRKRNEGLLALTWDYPTEGPHHEPVAESVLKEINGWTVADKKLVPNGFGGLEADGSTACGCWIYCGVFPDEGKNLANQRESKDFHGHGWGWAWPMDRRVLYNRASAKPDGTPWSERKKLVWWDPAQKKWTGDDVPDFVATKPPDYQPKPDDVGDAGLKGDKPFILHADGLGWLWVPEGLNDGPLPTHYEPLESPVRNKLYDRQTNPVSNPLQRPGNSYATSPDPLFPYVLTTYRLTEHHTAGGMSRYLSHLAELQPDLFAEISPSLAKDLGIINGDWITVLTRRGAVEAHATVTSRMVSLQINGQRVEQVGMPFHWGHNGLVKGDIGNDLIAFSEEPNVRIMETKGVLCSVLKGRRSDNAKGISDRVPAVTR
jgi:formate dehydrogenase major subunit